MGINHLAIIMDGNRRWATERGLKILEGHQAGIETLTDVTEYCAKVGIKYLTVYALSTENLAERSKGEIAGLLRLIEDGLRKKLPELKENGVRLEFVGDLSFLPSLVRKGTDYAYKFLKENKRIQLNICLNYGGRDEILSAIKKIIQSSVKSDEINEKLFKSYLYTKDLPDPDLIIRTGGQSRLSNFLLWQAAYSELFFTDSLWPDFSTKELDSILTGFSERKRNFGR